MNNKPVISVVIPVFNEKDSVAELYRQLSSAFRHVPEPYEVIFVNDGSIDGTQAELEKLEGPVTVVSFPRNFGKTQALKAGFDHSEGEYLITLDADLQDDPREIPKFLEELKKGYSLVCGWKHKRQDSLSKRIASKVANGIARIITKSPVHDMNCGFRAYRRSVIENIQLYGDMHRYIPPVVSSMGFSVTEIRVNHRPRLYGKSKYGFKRFFSSFFDFITLVFLKKFTDRPMHFFGFFGLFVSLAGWGILAYLGWIRIVEQELIGGRPVLFLGMILVLVGFQLFSIGLLGELLIRQSNKQTYIISEIKNKSTVQNQNPK